MGLSAGFFSPAQRLPIGRKTRGGGFDLQARDAALEPSPRL
jgi:hypothetical protein